MKYDSLLVARFYGSGLYLYESYKLWDWRKIFMIHGFSMVSLYAFMDSGVAWSVLSIFNDYQLNFTTCSASLNKNVSTYRVITDERHCCIHIKCWLNDLHSMNNLKVIRRYSHQENVETDFSHTFEVTAKMEKRQSWNLVFFSIEINVSRQRNEVWW